MQFLTARFESYRKKEKKLKKKIFTAILFIFMAIFVFEFTFEEQEKKEYNKLLYIGEKQGETFSLIVKGNIKNQYEEIIQCLDIYNANMYSTVIKNESSKKQIVKYIYVNDFSYFHNEEFYNGRFFNKDEMESDLYLSTNNANDSNKIGKILDFSGSVNYTIKTFKSGLNDNMLSGKINLVISKSKYKSFLSDLKSKGIDIIETEYINNSQIYVNKSYIYIVLISVIIIFLALLIFDLFNSIKDISIKKMLGYSRATLCIEKIKTLVITECACSVLVFLVLSALKFKEYNHHFFLYAKKVLLLYSLVIVISILSVLLIYSLSASFSVTDIAKNSDQNLKIIIFNMFLKTVISVVLLVISGYCFSDYSIASKSYQNKYEKWNETKNYYCVNGIGQKTDIEDVEILNDSILNASYNAYMEFDKNGAILSEFSLYEEEMYELNKRYHTQREYECGWATVNPNYLKKNILLDTNDNIIEISEEEESGILLMPEKYKKFEQDIKQYFYDLFEYKNSSREYKIIWLKNKQKAFSYRLDVGDNCFVEDPVIRVLSRKNSNDMLDYAFFGGYNFGPVKVECNSDKEVVDFYATLYKYFDNSIYVFDVYNLYSSISSEIDSIHNSLEYKLLIIFSLIVTLISVSVQNNIVYFIEYSNYISVFHLLGYSFWDKHISLFINFVWSSAIIFIVSILISRELMTIPLVLIFLIIELLFCFIIAGLYEKRNIVYLLKKKA